MVERVPDADWQSQQMIISNSPCNSNALMNQIARDADAAIGHHGDTFRIEAIGNNIKVWINGVQATNLINNKYSNGYITLKIHSLKAGEKGEEVMTYFKNICIITKDLAKYAQPADIKQITVK